MAREVILFYTDETYKVFSESDVYHITKTDLKNTTYAFVSVGQCEEVQCYLPIKPEFLITTMEPGTFSYCFEYSVYSSDITEDPELYPMDTQTVELNSIFDLYDAIYFMAEIIFNYDVMNPNKFDDYRVLDVLEVKIDVPDSSQKPIHYYNRVKKTRVESLRNLAAEDIYTNMKEVFGIDTDLTNARHPWIHIHSHHKKCGWTVTEDIKANKNKIDIVAYPLSTNAMIFTNVNTLQSLNDIDVPLASIYMYDLSMIGEEQLIQIVDDHTADDYLEESYCGIIASALISREGVLTFLIELKFIDECIKFCMALHEYCNANGVLYVLRCNIQRQMFSPVNGSSIGFLKSKYPLYTIYDFNEAVKREKPLSQFLMEYDRGLRGEFVYDNNVPF